MDPAALDASNNVVLLEVIKTLQQQLEMQQRQAEQDRHAARTEIARLVTMLEGLTRQLDELLRDRDEERRAALAQLKATALAEANAAVAAQSSEAQPSAEPPDAEPDTRQNNRHNHGKRPMPEDLPRDEVVLRAGQCSACGSDNLRDSGGPPPIEEYDYVRAHLRIKHTVRKACTCNDCGQRMDAPPPPPMPFERASCTPALMAWLLFARAGLFLPLDRIRRDLEAQGASIPSATLTRWYDKGCDLLLSIGSAVKASLLCDTHIRMDGTGLLVVHQKKLGSPKSGEVRQGETDALGYLLRESATTQGTVLVFGNDEHAVYHYASDGKGERVLSFLTVGKDGEGQPIRWRGTLTADALSAYDCVFSDGERTETGCNSHGFRKFRDEADKAPLLASTAMGYIGRFFSLEAKAREQGLVGVELLAYRNTHIRPVAASFRTWLDTHICDLLKTHPIRKAMQYYLNHWPALTRFLEDPAVELSNNWSERALRKVALFRNNSMYVGGEAGAQRLCTVLTLIGTCRALGVDAYSYLVWALTRVVAHPDNRGLVESDLTPAAYKEAVEQGDAG